MRYLYAIVALGLLVALHELGHLLVARLFKIRVERFSIGFGPPMFVFKRRTIEWVLAAIPFGGYVRVHGMNPRDPAEVRAEPDSFLAQAWWKRELVLVSGSVFNAAIAFAVLIALFVSGTHVPVRMTVGTVEPGSEAARAQLRPGDEIVSVAARAPQDWTELVGIVQDSAGRRLPIEVRRGAERVLVEVTPRADEASAGRIGITQQYVFRELSFGEAVTESVAYIARLLRDGWALLGRAVQGKPGVELASPVLIVKQASDAAALGWDAFVRVLATISVGLALFYLLPFPSLDGGRMILTAIEGIRGKPLNPKLETALHTLSFVALFALILIIAAGDVLRMRGAAPLEAASPQAQPADAGSP